tara:strand:- start:422 stop:1132 length:711 start_codon:yes stop_codon:yes gene_type:complete
MKKIILLISVFFCLSSCSSLEIQGLTSSEEETQRILALGLSHEENLAEATKLNDPHMVTVVSLQLTNAYDDKIQAGFDAIDSEKISSNVIVSSNGLNFIGPEVSESITTILNVNPDLINYHIEGSKNQTSDIIDHKLNLSLAYNSDKKRNFISANLCDRWSRCDGDRLEIINMSVIASNCNGSSCDFKENVELNLTDDFLRDYINKGFTIRFNSKKNSTKVKISKSYLMGYLKVAQ